MKHKKYDDEKVVCPFYKYQEAYRICCEGVQKNSNLILAFTLPKYRIQYNTVYCNSIEGHKNCTIAQILYKKY
jgi:hypothetical protein